MRTKFLPLVVLGLLAPSSRASDFSELGKPDFARALLMSPQQREEMACTQGWVAASADKPLAPLIAEMDERHAVALGSRRFAEQREPIMDVDMIGLSLENTELADESPNGSQTTKADVSPLSIEEARKARLAELPPRCAELSAAFTTGGLTAAMPLLAPRPLAVIALPSTGHCLKQLEVGRFARDDDRMAKEIRAIRAQVKRSRLIEAAEKAAIERDYAAFTPPAVTASIPVEERSVTELHDLICFPVLADISARLRGER